MPKKDENGEWRRLHNEELHSLFRSSNIVSVNLGPRGMRTGSGEGSTMRNFIVCTVHLILSV